MLVGRDAERRRLDELLARARLGLSGVLVLVGEAGIGKTALLADLRDRARDLTLLSVTGTEAERDLPFAGLAQLVRVQPADLASLPEPQAEALGVALALREGASADRFAVGSGLLTLLAQRSEARPVCLVVDDAHQLDTPSADALLFVARRLLADSIALVIAVRAGEPCRLADPALPRLNLSGLDSDATRVLVEATVGGGSAGLADRVFDLSLGNPLAIRELAVDPDAMVEDLWGLPRSLPESLSRAYARRAEELSAAALTVLRCAVVTGGSLSVLARACADLGVDVSALVEAEDAGLVSIDGDRVLFQHPLVRSALYAGADASIRRRLHAAAATAAGADDPDRRAWHLSEATLGPDSAAAAELDRLAERAADRSADAVAARAADRAAVLSETASDRARRRLAAGIWAWRAGDTDRARRWLSEAAAAGAPGPIATRASHVLGVIAVRSGTVDEARDVLRHAAAGAADPEDALASLAEAVDACYYLGDAVGAMATADTIVGLLDAATDPDVSARAAIAAGCARILAGEDGGSLIRAGMDRLAIPDAGGEPALAAWAIIGPLFLRDSRTGRTQLERAVRDRRARSALGELPHLLFHIARDEATSDRWDRAEADYSEAVALARELGQSTEVAASLAGLAWLEARCGRVAEATAHSRESLALCDRHHVHLMAVWARWAEADLAYGLGAIETALAGYEAIADLLDRLGLRDVDLSPAPEIVECRLRLGRTDGVSEVAASYERGAADKGQPWARARAGRLRGLLAADDKVDERFAQAIAHHDATLDVYERARTLLLYGSRLRRARRRVDARAALQPALDAFVRLGAAPFATNAADELAATGATVVRPGESPRSRLTPRELQIAVLLTEGNSTREAASALFLSPKTVEYHLRNAYTKLGVSNRTELAGLLRQS